MAARTVTDGDHAVALHLHFAPDVALEILHPNRAVAKWGSDSTRDALQIAVFGREGVMEGGEDSVSKSYGELSSARTAVFIARGHGQRELVSFLVPQDGEDQALDIHERSAIDARSFMVVNGGSRTPYWSAEAARMRPGTSRRMRRGPGCEGLAIGSCRPSSSCWGVAGCHGAVGGSCKRTHPCATSLPAYRVRSCASKRTRCALATWIHWGPLASS